MDSVCPPYCNEAADGDDEGEEEVREPEEALGAFAGDVGGDHVQDVGVCFGCEAGVGV